jgi:hypothetical protein
MTRRSSRRQESRSSRGVVQSGRERELLWQLARGERDIAQGEGHSLDSVLRGADALLEGDSP